MVYKLQEKERNFPMQTQELSTIVSNQQHIPAQKDCLNLITINSVIEKNGIKYYENL